MNCFMAFFLIDISKQQQTNEIEPASSTVANVLDNTFPPLKSHKHGCLRASEVQQLCVEGTESWISKRVIRKVYNAHIRNIQYML